MDQDKRHERGSSPTCDFLLLTILYQMFVVRSKAIYHEYKYLKLSFPIEGRHRLATLYSLNRVFRISVLSSRLVSQWLVQQKQRSVAERSFVRTSPFPGPVGPQILCFCPWAIGTGPLFDAAGGWPF